MNYTRLIIGFSVAVLLISVASGILGAMREPDNDGRLKDSYGTRFFGSRGVYETLLRLGLPAERSLTPPDRAALRGTNMLAAGGARPTLALISPSPSVVTLEPEYLRNLRAWVEQGGRLVLVAGRRSDPGESFGIESGKREELNALLGLEGLRSGVRPPQEQPEKKEDTGRTPKNNRPRKKALSLADGNPSRLAADSPTPQERPGEEGAAPDKAGGGEQASDGEEKRKDGKAGDKEPERLEANFYKAEVEGIDLAERMYGTVVEAPAFFDGAFGVYGTGVAKLALPQEPEVILEFGKTAPAGRLEIELDQKRVAAGAVFRLGAGEVVYLSDAALFFNRFFARADNAILCVNVLGGEPAAGGGLRPTGRILVDEFFHGLNIQGNAWWLLTRMPYGLIALTLFLAAGLWAWRGARRLGPAVPLQEQNRRSLREYVEAMARLFQRAQMRRYVFEQAYAGALWHIRRELKLDPRAENPQALVKALERRQPERARRLEAACAQAQLLLSQEKINRRDAVRVIKEMGRCL